VEVCFFGVGKAKASMFMEQVKALEYVAKEVEKKVCFIP
jgi:hypothetical protein